MNRDAPALVEKIVAALRRGPAPRSSADLAREFLGMGLLDERAAAVVLDPVLRDDSRLLRQENGWSVRESASRYAADDPPLASARLCIFAPRHPPVAAVTTDPDGSGEPRYAVALSGAAGAERAALRGQLGRAPRPVVDLGTLARRWRGFKGPRDPRAIAAHAGCRVVDGDTPESMAAILAACWRTYLDELALEGVSHVSDVSRLIEERLEAADFDGKRFGPSDLDALAAVPGVYEFGDDAGRVLYVGQSSCLAVRVRSYFTGPPRDEKDRTLRLDATTLATRRAPSAPDALIDEMRRIARLRPSLNARRAVREEGAEDGIVLAPRFAESSSTPSGWIWFAITEGRLAGRGSLLPGPSRARRAAREAVTAFTAAAHEKSDESRRCAVLVDTWRRASPAAPWLRLAIDGSAEDIEAALTRLARSSH